MVPCLFYNCLLMNIVGSSNSKNIVSLEQLVPQHDCLKLLILHTPYTLVIDTLNLCVNLVKLDLSKNNLESFPYLGNLKNLKFMFIHENKLDITGLKNIFELNGKKSNLSENIVWVTFWGNKNAFLGRHYLANQTSAIAIDQNMVVQQEKSPEFPVSYYEPFGAQTDISTYFTKKGAVNRFASEEEYMRQLWLEMAELRKKHEKLFPIIKIQKVFRGWMVRVSSYRKNRNRDEFIKVLKTYFGGWKLFVKRKVKLQRLLKQNRKEYLLLDLHEMRVKQNIYKMVEIAKEIKRKFFNRRLTLKNQFKFYNIVRQNYLLLKNLYQQLDLTKSKAVYIHKNQWELFTNKVIPFIRLINPAKVTESNNQRFCLHLLYDFFSEKSKQFIKIMQTNLKSMVYETKNTSPIQGKKAKKPMLYGCRLKPIFSSTHIPTSKKFRLQAIIQKLDAKRSIGLCELIKIEGDQLLLKDIVRGVYFFNTGRLQNPNIGIDRINLFTEYSLKKISAVTKIQKIWRGFSFRKKNEDSLKILLKVQRATIIIQRWFRKLPMYKKKIFIYTSAKKLWQVKESTFYIDIGEYFTFLSQKQSNPEKPIFNELDSKVYLHTQSNTLSLCWNNRSENLQIGENIRLKKWLFNRKFLKEKVGLSDDQINVKMVYDSTKHQPCSYAHIFHFGTESSIVTKAKKRYLEVKCSSRNQAKFRIFILLVCSYQLKIQNQLNIYLPSHFRLKDIANKIAIGKSQTSFICNENFNLIKQCETMFRNEPNIRLHVITNKFYFQSLQKPLKIQQKFFIYTYAAQQIEKKQYTEDLKQQKEEKRYVTEPAKTQQGHFHLLTEHDTEGIVINKHSQPTAKMKILIKKRSVKQYKIDKKGKSKKKDHPNFVLDSMSMNDRLTTQPDAILTQISNQQNNSLEHNFQHTSLEKNDIKIRQRLTYIQKRNHSFKRKQEDNFTKRFVNLGNFIQNQYANDYRRRIKTQLQNRAVDSAQQVRRQIQRSQSQKIQDTQEKHKKIREKHSQHRELVEKTQSLMREHSLQIKNEVIESREKKMKEKSKLKRLKVSFAQQCYPLASKHKKNEYFPS